MFLKNSRVYDLTEEREPYKTSGRAPGPHLENEVEAEEQAAAVTQGAGAEGAV